MKNTFYLICLLFVIGCCPSKEYFDKKFNTVSPIQTFKGKVNGYIALMPTEKRKFGFIRIKPQLEGTVVDDFHYAVMFIIDDLIDSEIKLHSDVNFDIIKSNDLYTAIRIRQGSSNELLPSFEYNKLKDSCFDLHDFIDNHVEDSSHRLGHIDYKIVNGVKEVVEFDNKTYYIITFKGKQYATLTPSVIDDENEYFIEETNNEISNNFELLKIVNVFDHRTYTHPGER